MIIAEIGTSHQGSLQKAFELIDTAADSGADAVKFQWVYAHEILHPNTGFVTLPTGNIPLYDRFKELECPFEFYQKTLEYTRAKNIKYICSPFGIQSLRELLSLKPDAVKIASPELNHYPLLKELAKLRQNAPDGSPVPVILSTGVSTLADIEKALNIIGKNNVTLLHCITSYPAPEEEYNLKIISNLSAVTGVPCGVSDHSLDPVLVPALAFAAGAVMIEKHITISKLTSGLDDPVALEGEQFAQMVHAIHNAKACISRYGSQTGFDRICSQLEEQFGKDKVKAVLGTGIKTLADSESPNYGRTNRSLHYTCAFKKGHIINPQDIAVLRTEKILTPGISPEFLELLYHKTLTCDVENGQGVKFEDFMEHCAD